LILGVITKDALVPLADAEAEAALDEFEKSLSETMRAREAQLADMAASQAKIDQATAAAKTSAETLARGGAGLPAAG
jgi:multidrug resistance efflux pump